MQKNYPKTVPGYANDAKTYAQRMQFMKIPNYMCKSIAKNISKRRGKIIYEI